MGKLINQYKRLSLLLLLLGFSGLTLMAGGPWPQPKGKGYFKLSQWWLTFDQHYTDVGLIDPNVTTGVFNTSIYGEYGFSPRFTGIVYLPFFSRNLMNNVVSGTTGEVIIPGEAVNSIGDIDISMKYALTKPGSAIPVSATLLLGIPSGRVGAGTQGNLQTGDGEFNQMLRFDAGKSFSLGKIPAYSSAYVGVNNRTNGFSDEFRYGLEAGLSFLDQDLWIIGRLAGIESFKNGETAQTVNSTSIFANNTEYTQVSAEVAWYAHKQFGISAGITGILRGEIIAAAPAYTVGIFLDLNK